jgi:hypothetical protein
LVERLGNLLATIEGVEQSALELIANVQPEAVVVVGAAFFDSRLDASISTVAPL